jgi:GNAT superfamily N-acetyltransferase
VITIRAAEAADADVVWDIAVQAFDGYTERIGRPPAPMVADYHELVAGGWVWVVLRDGVVAGFAVLVPRTDHLLLETIAVAPEHQGQGLGSGLLAFTDDVARREGLGEIRLCTNEAMTENLAYYPRHGYRETHRETQDGYRRVFFSRTVDA